MMSCHVGAVLGAPPCGSGVRGQITSALPDFNQHHSMVLGEILMLPHRLYPSVGALGRRNGRAAAVDNRPLLRLTLVHPRAPNRHLVVRF